MDDEGNRGYKHIYIYIAAVVLKQGLINSLLDIYIDIEYRYIDG